MKSFAEILRETMGYEEEARFFPPNFDPTKRNGGVWEELWNFPGNPDDYVTFLSDFIEHHWCPHHTFDELNHGAEKIADAVSNAWWNGYMAGFNPKKDDDRNKEFFEKLHAKIEKEKEEENKE